MGCSFLQPEEQIESTEMRSLKWECWGVCSWFGRVCCLNKKLAWKVFLCIFQAFSWTNMNSQSVK